MAGKEKPNQIVHRLINEERRRRGLPWVRWSQKMYVLAKDQSNKMAKAGRLFHSNRYALKGGENCWMGKGYSERALPKAIVNSWMKSREGHREWILDPRVKTAAVAISRSKHGTFAAWAFSDQPLHQPGKAKPCGFKIPINLTILLPRNLKGKADVEALRLLAKLLLICASVFLVILGAHGIWVYFNRLELLFGGGASKLFLVLQVPSWLRTPVEWMSFKGVQSWFVPAVSAVIGIVLWYWQRKMNTGNLPRWLTKLRQL